MSVPNHDLSAVRLVASDLDGTLLGPGGVLSERTIAAVTALAEVGVEMVVATGRSHHSALPLIRSLGTVRWLIGSNGATVYDMHADAVVERRVIDPEKVEALVSAAQRHLAPVGWSWETPHGQFHDDRWVDVRRSHHHDYRPVFSDEAVLDPAGSVMKLMVGHHRLSGYEWLDVVEPHVPDGVSAATSGAPFVECTAADKGSAVAALCARLGVSRSATIAFGDNSNDSTMLRWVGRGYAMANAAPRIVGDADATAGHHADDGVAEVLEALRSQR